MNGITTTKASDFVSRLMSVTDKNMVALEIDGAVRYTSLDTGCGIVGLSLVDEYVVFWHTVNNAPDIKGIELTVCQASMLLDEEQAVLHLLPITMSNLESYNALEFDERVLIAALQTAPIDTLKAIMTWCISNQKCNWPSSHEVLNFIYS